MANFGVACISAWAKLSCDQMMLLSLKKGKVHHTPLREHRRVLMLSLGKGKVYHMPLTEHRRVPISLS